MSSFVNYRNEASVVVDETSSKDTVTYYRITVRVGPVHWNVLHRYNDFVELHEKLVSNHGVAKELLPPKKVIRNKTPKFIEQRKEALDVYLKNVFNYLKLMMPSEFAHFLDMHLYDIFFLLQDLAKTLFLEGDKMLQNGKSHKFSPMELHAISERLKMACPPMEKQDQMYDFSHILDYCSQLRALNIEGSYEKLGTSNIVPNNLQFDLIPFKTLQDLTILGVPMGCIQSVGSLRDTLISLSVLVASVVSMNEFLLVDILHKDPSSIADTVNWKKLNTVNFASNNIQDMDWAIKLVPKLRHLSLSSNKLTELCDVSCLHDLRILNLSMNNFEVVGETCVILLAAVVRYERLLHEQQDATRAIRRELLRRNMRRRSRSFVTGLLQDINIELTRPCETYPHLEMDESYNLTVEAESHLKSASIWGILRGLETFAQLFYPSDNFNGLLVNATEIYDFPRYAHRGLMLDTSRHYISLANIKLNLDAMAINKMNVFHWHIVDDQSFPYQSEALPELSEKGAYHPTMVYTKADIKEIVEYARDRGIRVIPEIDIPGHTRSWGVAYPQVLTECFDDNKMVGLGPMNPISDFTYKLLEDLLREVQEWFPDDYYHLGGDEVDMECWASNPYLLDYMLHYNVSSVPDFHKMFMDRVLPILATRSRAIVWQDVFDEYVPLPEDSLVQIWRSGWQEEINSVLTSGLGAIFSSEWYLSDVKFGGDWERFYLYDPRLNVEDKSLLHKVVGGEACLWGEYIDDRNFINRIWPRASGVAERLWSYASLDWVRMDQDVDDLETTRERIEEHACRMVRRQVAAQPPNGPGFCVT